MAVTVKEYTAPGVILVIVVWVGETPVEATFKV